MNSLFVSIVLPVRNQADHLRELITSYEKVLAGWHMAQQYILMVKACSDASLPIAQELSTLYASLRVLATDTPGWGSAVREGIRAAVGDPIAFANCARTNAATLAALIAQALGHRDAIVKANRQVRDGMIRRLGSWAYNCECRILFGLKGGDVNGTPKIFPRRFTPLLELTRSDDLLDLEFGIVCRDEGYHVLEVPTASIGRHGGNSTTNFRSAARMYLGAYQLWQARRGLCR